MGDYIVRCRLTLTVRIGLLAGIQDGGIKGENVIVDVGAIATAVEKRMGGTSGALYS